MSPEFEANLLRILENQGLLAELSASRAAETRAGPAEQGDGNLQRSQQHPEEPRRQNQNEFLIESLASGINEFNYDPEAEVTLEAWFAKYEDLFEEDARALDGPAKVRLLLRNPVAHKTYVNYLLPKKPKEVTFDEIIKTLKSIFGRQTSLFNQRYQCLQLKKDQADDYFTYARIVNEKCEEFKLSEINADQFKCLMFVSGLNSCKDSDVRITHRELQSRYADDNTFVSWGMPETLEFEEGHRYDLEKTGSKQYVCTVKHTSKPQHSS